MYNEWGCSLFLLHRVGFEKKEKTQMAIVSNLPGILMNLANISKPNPDPKTCAVITHHSSNCCINMPLQSCVWSPFLLWPCVLRPGPEGFSRVPPGGHLPPPQPESTAGLQGLPRGNQGLSEGAGYEVQDHPRPTWRHPGPLWGRAHRPLLPLTRIHWNPQRRHRRSNIGYALLFPLR